MPKGIRKTFGDKLYELASTVTVDEFVTEVAEMLALTLRGNSPAKMHEIFGEMNVRAQQELRWLKDFEAEQKAANRKKPGPKPGTKYGPRKLKPSGKVRAVNDKGKTIPVRKRAPRKVVAK